MAANAFKQVYLDPSLTDDDLNDYTDVSARSTRYELFWGYFSSNVYQQSVHKFAQQYMAKYGMYNWTRELYNPAYEIGAFYRTYLWGGALDLEAGDGKEKPSVLPIITENENLRPAIAEVWRSSGWRSKRLLVPLFGAILGDVFIRVIDDVEREKVYLEVINPNQVADVQKDPFGNVKEYTIEYQRLDDTNSSRTVMYREEARRDGDDVTFALFKDDAPYPWGFEQAAWSEPYGFMPMVHIQHIDVGLSYGMSEFLPKMTVFRELDDQASKINDQVRKMVDPFWLFAGVTRPKDAIETEKPATTTTKPQQGRFDQNALYSDDPSATAHPLIANLDLGNALRNIEMMLESLEKAYPELSLYRLRQSPGDLSGRAVRLLQRESATKVEMYRDTYDDALIRAQQMAIAIGGMREYEAFSGFNLESYSAGILDHTIGTRPVFANDPLDREELLGAQLGNQELALASGWPLEILLRMQEFDDERIAEITESEEYQLMLEQKEAENEPTEFGE